MELKINTQSSELNNTATSGGLFEFITIALLLVTVSACTTLNTASTRTQPAPVVPAPETSAEQINSGEFEPPIDNNERPEIIQSSEKVEPPVVVALAKKAEIRQQSGDYDQAAADLERALRIDSRNSRLWQQLAEVRLQQGDARQAEILASKSNRYAGNNTAIKKRNWQIISMAREQRGDIKGSSEATTKAAEF